VEHAAEVGQHLLAGLQAMAADEPATFSNARGLGLMCAIDFPDGTTRNAVADKAYDLGMVILACGQRSLRFRPPLDVTRGEIEEALDILRRAAKAVRE
jgi:L-lysine 6-transaminase